MTYVTVLLRTANVGRGCKEKTRERRRTAKYERLLSIAGPPGPNRDSRLASKGEREDSRTNDSLTSSPVPRRGSQTSDFEH